MKTIIKQKKISLVQKLINYVNDIIFKYIKEPRQKRKELAEKILAKQKEKTLFEEKYKTNHDEAIRLMNFKMGADSKFEYWDDKLVEGRKQVNEYSKYKSPSFYDPEICEIHNENLDNPSLIDYHTLIINETFKTTNEIKKQSIKLTELENENKRKEKLKQTEHNKYIKARENIRKALVLEENDEVDYTKFGIPEPKLNDAEIKMLKTDISKIKNR